MPEGAVARLMRTSYDNLIDSAHHAVWQAAQGLPAGEAPLVISVSGAGRRLVLGERTHEEVETVFDVAPARSGHVGFYSYGEISPAPLGGGASGLHHESMTVTVLREA